jgi:beta-phosphoglucomutase-like phosphatase (HAD superfamily)
MTDPRSSSVRPATNRASEIPLSPTVLAKRPFSAYIFDFDGTLADTEDLNLSAVQSALALYGADVTIGWLAAEPFTSSLRLRERLAADQSITVHFSEQELVAAARDFWLGHTDQVRPIAMASEIVKRIAGRAPIAIASDNDGVIVRAGLAAIGLDQVITSVIAREDVPRLKPAPDSFIAAARLLNVRPEHCLAYENTDHGLTAALAAGMRVIDVRTRWEL